MDRVALSDASLGSVSVTTSLGAGVARDGVALVRAQMAALGAFFQAPIGQANVHWHFLILPVSEYDQAIGFLSPLSLPSIGVFNPVGSGGWGATIPSSSVLMHEVTHAFLHHYVADLPSWYDEGAADFFSTDLAWCQKWMKPLASPLLRHGGMLDPSHDPPLLGPYRAWLKSRKLSGIDLAKLLSSRSLKASPGSPPDLIRACCWATVASMSGEAGPGVPQVVELFRRARTAVLRRDEWLSPAILAGARSFVSRL